MADRDWFSSAFGIAGAVVGDIRDSLIFDAWFGSASRPIPSSEFDRVLADKLEPDKAAERGFLGWLQAERGREQEPQTPEPDHGIDR